MSETHVSPFFQEGPSIRNQFTDDLLLQRYLKVFMPQEYLKEVEAELLCLGEAAAGPMLAWAEQTEKLQPKHIPYDPWGKRIDHIEVSDAWKQLEKTAAQHGLIATGYERKQKEFSRLFQMSLLHIYHPSSAFYSCPLAMTDGATRAIELYGDANMKAHAYKKLTSRDPQNFWTSGQWMTEKAGGSDVSTSDTTAKKVGSGFELFGTKWFTSATTAQMAMTLARIEGADQGSKGLSLFYLELRNSENNLNKIEIHRLKDKLGTKSLPTAELSLRGTPAVLVGGEGHGVKKIASLFNITRIYNSVCSVAHMRRGLVLAKDYSLKRVAFKKPISQHPLHQETLRDLYSEYCASFHLVMFAIRLLGKEECGIASKEESALLRLLTPVCKLSTGKRVMQLTSEVVEVFGGTGYVEDTVLPRMLRDAQVFPIWEGTTNVLSLDVLRAIEKEGGLAAAFYDFEKRLEKIKNIPHKETLESNVVLLKKFAAQATQKGPDYLQLSARCFSLFIADLYSGFLLEEFAQLNSNAQDLWLSDMWLKQKLSRSRFALEQYLDRDSEKIFDLASI